MVPRSRQIFAKDLLIICLLLRLVANLSVHLGPDRDLSIIDISDIRSCLKASSSEVKPLRRRQVDNATSVTVFIAAYTCDGLYLCAASADKLMIYKYNSHLRTFCLRKVKI